MRRIAYIILLSTIFLAASGLFAQNEMQSAAYRMRIEPKKELDDSSSVDIYQNSDKADVYVVINSAGFRNLQIEVYNILGKKIISQNDSNGNRNYFTVISMNDYPNGIYIFKIKVDNKVYRRRLTLVKS